METAPLGPELAIRPLAGPIDAVVTLPGSKSLTNRALVCAALAEGESTLTGVLRADDTEAMLGCLAALGTRIEADGDGRQLRVLGRAGALSEGPVTLDARMSGTTARFVVALAALRRGTTVVTGHQQLRERPMADSIGALRGLGVRVRELERPGRLPLALVTNGAVAGGEVALAGDVSSQFLSGLLLAAPVLDGPLTITLTSRLVSEPYVAMTASVMRAFGATVTSGAAEGGPRSYTVEPSGYRAARYRIEPDASAASYFFAAAAVLGGRVEVAGLNPGSPQGDLRFVEVLRQMGCEVAVTAGATVVRGTGELRGIEVDLADMSDTAPTLAVVAAFASSPTRVSGIGFIRGKETDRIAAVVAELRRCGVDADEEPDGFVVRPPAGGPTPARIHTYEDHRMAMAFAVLGLRAPGIVVLDPGCVVKTFPDFFEHLDRLR